MAKTVIQLGLEGRSLRGIRLENDGDETKCNDAVCWPYDAPPSEEEGEAPSNLPANPEDEPLDDEDAAADEVNPLESALVEAAAYYRTREVSLSLPLSELFVKVLKFPADRREDLDDLVAEEMKSLSPFPDEDLKVGWEIVRETEKELFVSAAALPESTAGRIGESLAAAKLTVVRTDATALGWIRTLWPRITEKPGVGRRLVMLDLDGNGWELAVLDDDTPVILRGLGMAAGGDMVRLRREIMLSLMEADRFSGGREVGEVLVFAHGAVSPETQELLADYGEVRVVECEDESGGVEGCARREDEDCTFDVTPYTWAEALKEGRFKRRLNLSVAVAFGVWILAVAAAVGGLFVVDALTGRVTAKSKRHQREYKQVNDMRERVELVKRYSDHNRGVLEILKAVSDRLPDGVTLTSFQFKRDEGVKISGEAEQPTMVYEFKNALVKSEAFAVVNLRGPSASRGIHKFDIDTAFEAKEED